MNAFSNFFSKLTLKQAPQPVDDVTIGFFGSGDTAPDWTSRDTQYRQGYMLNAFVEEACELYAVRISSVDHIIYSESDDDITDQITNPFIALMDRPNPRMTRAEFMHLIGLYLGIHGEAFVYPHRTSFGYDAMYVIDPKLMSEVTNPIDVANPVEHWYCSKFIDGQNIFLPEELIHIRFPDPDMSKVRGLSRMAACGKNIEMMNAIMDWNIAVTNNGAKPSVAIKVPSRLTSEQRTTLKNEMREGYQGKRNAGNGMILDDGKDVSVLGMSAVDMDYQEGLTNAARQIAIAYGIPPEMMGDSANKTYNNAQEAARQIVVNTVRPLLDLVYSAIWNFFKGQPIAKGIKLYTYDEEQLSDFMGVQTDLYTALQQASFLTANDKRKKLGYDAIDDPLADELMVGIGEIPMSEYSAEDVPDDPGKKDPKLNDLNVLLGDRR